MRFLLVSHNDSDGVGQTVTNLNVNLNRLGHKSKIILLNQSTTSKNIIKIKKSFVKRFFFYFLEFFKKKYSDLFSFGNSIIDYKSLEEQVRKTDVVIVYTLHKILSMNMLAKLFNKNKIIYLRPLDMELATGGCHVNFTYEDGNECKKYLTGCHRCPKLNNLNILNFSHKIFTKKKFFMNKFKPTILLENKYTKKLYDKSPITKNARNEVIYLPVRESRQNLINKTKARKKFHLGESDKILLFGTYNLDAPHKGGRMMKEILNLFVKYCNKKNKDLLKDNKIKLVTFGRKQNFHINVPHISWHHLKVIKGDKKLNSLYRSADVFISPASGCNAPSTIREATINNIPTIGFDNGEASEAIKNNVNGFLIPEYNKKKFAVAIFNILFNKKFKKDGKWNNLLLKRYNSKTEANSIISKALEDIKR